MQVIQQNGENGNCPEAVDFSAVDSAHQVRSVVIEFDCSRKEASIAQRSFCEQVGSLVLTPIKAHKKALTH